MRLSQDACHAYAYASITGTLRPFFYVGARPSNPSHTVASCTDTLRLRFEGNPISLDIEAHQRHTIGRIFVLKVPVHTTRILLVLLA